MNHDDPFFPTIVFDPPATSPDRHRHRRRHRHRHRRVPPLAFIGDWATDSSTDYYCSESDDRCSSSNGGRGGSGIHSYHRPRRQRHRHTHLPAGLPLGTPNALVRRPPAPAAAAAPRNYGYRRLHYQGGQERRGRQRTRPAQCHANTPRGGGCGARSPQRNILVRCGRWLFGESRRCYCGRWGCGGGCCAPGTGHCGNGRSRGRSPTRRREEEYWGPGTQNWVYGPTSRNANWRDTPWSSGGYNGTNAYNLAPGGVVEEVEEGGTLPAVATVADQTHNHYHIGSNGRSRRSSPRRDVRDYMRDHGILGLVNRERDRELDRNMVDRQTADRERDRAYDRDMMDRETAKQRDHYLLALLDRERERELNSAMVDRATTKQRDNRLLTLLDRERDRDRGGKDTLDLLDHELERRRDLRPGANSNDRNKRLGAREESNSEGEGGLRAEIEALRCDFRKLMRSTSKTRGGVGTKRPIRCVSAVNSLSSRSSGRQKVSADIQFTHGRTIDDGGGENEDEDEDGDDSASSSRKVFGDGGAETDQALQVPLPTDEPSDSS